ncbi:MAG: potassium transporter Kup [Chthoniobacteraceae bacterium]
MNPSSSGDARTNRRRLLTLTLAALGIVYGDIGTSPLYAMRECFHGPHAIAASPANILGILSLIFWALVIVISVKYLVFILRADNRGEGGILALSALVAQVKSSTVLVVLGVFGAALLYSDGMITPAITVLSAVEGLEVAMPGLEAFIEPIAIVILIGIFLVQSRGSAKIGALFGPVMLVWFGAIAALGVMQIAREPGVFAALSPLNAADFFARNGWHGFIILGAVFLVVTGGEALYADIGHFGVRPIRLGWFVVALPGLMLNYLGQGALLLRDPAAAANPFYEMAPAWALYPLIVLATAAAIIASQALITGAFSLTMQAVQLGFSPRLTIRHTSADAKGQIYLPIVNWVLLFSCIGLVLGFKSSSGLAAAYGVSITSTMLITTVLFYVVARWQWRWNPWVVGLLTSLFLVVDLAFLVSNFAKILHGGWFPLVVAGVVFTLMWTWRTGRAALGERITAKALPLGEFLRDVVERPPVRVAGTAFFMSGNPGITPVALLHNLRHNKVLHERIVILNVRIDDIPHVSDTDRLSIDCLALGFWRISLRFGFMDEPNVPRELDRIACEDFAFDAAQSSFFLGRESIIAAHRTPWRRALFAWMTRFSRDATSFFRLPPGSVVELGAQVEI